MPLPPFVRSGVLPTAILVAGGASLYGMGAFSGPVKQGAQLDYSAKIPSRKVQMKRLFASTAEDPLDILVVGGGATGTGTALDAASRGLKVGLIEREDFASGTSSRSTKLIHGGVRYLEKAFFQLDAGQLALVMEALHERRTFLENAPHLTKALPIMTPCYKWWEVPYYWVGLKVYDLVAGTRGLTMSSLASQGESRHHFPTLASQNSEGKTLKGSVVYYDGQFDDARMAVSLATSSAYAGAVVANYTECLSLLKKDGQVVGARVRDVRTGEEADVYARVVVNATGCFSDGLRQMSDPQRKSIVMPSAGVHVTLPDYYSPDNMGMIVPETKDGRVVFMLPWMGHTIAGTTDTKCPPDARPQPREEDIEFILDALKEYLNVKVRRSDVLSAWSGIRPLAANPSAKSTENASREHVVAVEGDGMVTVAGGKWTTYRKMAEDVVDKALELPALGEAAKRAGACVTESLRLVGATHWHPALHTEVAQNYVVPHRPGAIDTGVAIHLSHSYGDKAALITRIAEKRGLGRRLVRGHPELEAEVVYCAANEYCETVVDFLAHRTRLAFKDTLACRTAVPRVAELLAEEKGWTKEQTEKEVASAYAFLDTFDSPKDTEEGVPRA